MFYNYVFYKKLLQTKDNKERPDRPLRFIQIYCLDIPVHQIRI